MQPLLLCWLLALGRNRHLLRPQSLRGTCGASRHGDFLPFRRRARQQAGDKAPSAAKASTAPATAPATDAERQAITFLSYDLDVHLQPREHAMAVRARILLRNDSGSPLQPASLADFFHLAMDQCPRRRCSG